jgi:DNA-binding response OmpR family regulator
VLGKALKESSVGILIIDDDLESQLALRYVLDSEDWRVRVVPLVHQGLADLATGDWILVIVNVALTDLSGPVFEMLKDLSQADVTGGGRKRARVLFLIPELLAKEAQPVLESGRIPYVLKPFHLHDFLEKVSDLLMEAQAIKKPIRPIRLEPAKDKRKKDRRSGIDRRQTMFASRTDYEMTEEEIADFERQEEEDRKKREKREKEVENL